MPGEELMGQNFSVKKKIAIIFLVLTGVLMVAICIAVPLGMANSEASTANAAFGAGSPSCNLTDAVNGTCEDDSYGDPQPAPEEINTSEIYSLGNFISRDTFWP